MDRFSSTFERWYEYVHERSSELLQHWRVHTNRRTIFFALITGALAAYLYLYMIRPPESFPAGELVTIDEGASVQLIAETLEANGVIRSPLMFRLTVKLLGKDRQLHAGDYLFKEPKDVFAVAKRVAIGAYGLEPYRIRIPEGATIKEMARVFSTVLSRFDEDRFMRQAQPMEGFFFPDTYFFLPNATDEIVMQTMRENFDGHIATIEAEIADSGHTLEDIVIMASILEREARKYEDRRLIAGVLWRRIKKGMALQADATFLYTLGKGSFDLTMEDLKSDSPYNTYKYKGLPPTAIGSPSLASLEAAATPIDKGYLFYLADASGVTHYAKTYKQHQANERTYLGK